MALFPYCADMILPAATLSLIIGIIVFLIIASVLWWIFTLLPLPQPGKNIALAVILLILLLVFLSGGIHFTG